MDTDLISYESMLAARDSASWAFWGMVATWSSLVVSVLTLVLAYLALTSWKKQEELKVKQNFKESLFQLRSLLLSMPERIEVYKLSQGRQLLTNPDAIFQIGILPKDFNQRKEYAKDFERVEEGMQKCLACWIATENLLSGTKLNQLWRSISIAFEGYAQGKGKKADLTKEIDMMLEQSFVF
ncbi:TPA: hypothetical protein ACKP1J_001212 [Serratia liquefaciens]